MPRKKATETPVKTNKKAEPTSKPIEKAKVVKTVTSVQKKENETIKEIRRQTKVLQNTMKTGKFTEDWEEVGGNMWLKFKGDESGKHFVVGASCDRKPIFTLYGVSPISEYSTIIDSVILEKESNDKLTLKFTNKLGEYRHQFSF